MRQETPATFELPLDRILEDRNRSIRIFYGDLDEFAVQLMTEGQREPMQVRENAGQYFLVDGHRRQRALARSLQLRIQREEGKFVVYDGVQPLREAPGPVHAGYDPKRVPCRLTEPGRDGDELFAAQLLANRGKPFTTLERSLFLSRFLRQGGPAKEAWALKAGFSPEQIAQARELHAADPRLLDQVREGRLSPQIALRLLRAAPAEGQMARLKGARAAAERQHRDKLLAQDFEEGDGAGARPADGAEPAAEGAGDNDGLETPVEADSAHARLKELVARLGDVARFAPNPAAQDRLGTLLLIHRYAEGRIPYERLEAHLLGRR